MPFQKCPIFVLEGYRFVMRLLLGHVMGDRLNSGLSYLAPSGQAVAKLANVQTAGPVRAQE
jgi:hypothetical protein